MREFITGVAKADYSITFRTDDRKAYEQVETLCRMLVDGRDGEAIPVEWIEKQIEKASSVDSVDMFYLWNLKYLIKEWREENEQREDS